MRPASIVKFERAALLIVVVSLAAAVVGWEETRIEVARVGISSNAVMAALGAVLAVLLVLAWLASRRRSNVARWAYVVLTLLMLASAAPSIRAMLEADTVTMVLNLGFVLLVLVSIWLLFRPDTKPWFAGRNDEDGAGASA